MATGMNAARTPRPALEATHACVRCGAPVPLPVAMCERCNPLGLKQPASSQAHGTVFVGIVLAVIALAILGRLAIAGVGPFTAAVGAVVSDPPNLVVTLTVTNDGTKSGATTCRVFDPAFSGIGPESDYIQSPQIAAGATVSFSKEVTTLGSNVRPLGVDCTGP
jgi:hypothetical protein